VIDQGTELKEKQVLARIADGRAEIMDKLTPERKYTLFTAARLSHMR
jgi:hypothetical protein